MMLGKRHWCDTINKQNGGKTGILRVAPIMPGTEAVETQANQHEDAAILKCDGCGKVVIDNATSSRPDRYRKARVPDQSVFEVEVKK